MSESSEKNGSGEKDETPDGGERAEVEAPDAPAEDADASADGAAAKVAETAEIAQKSSENAKVEEDADDVVPAPAKGKEPEGPRPSFVFLALAAGVTLAADLGTKLWVEGRFPVPNSGQQLDVWKGRIALTHHRNPGGAWGLLGGESPALRITFFVAISVVAVVFILSLYRKTTLEQKALTWGLPLVLGGALGNLVDRIRYGEVVDFIKVHLGSYQYPTFNVADIAICVGVGLMAIDMFTPRKRRKATAKDGAVSVKAAS